MDVAQWYKLLLLYGLGYVSILELGAPLKRNPLNCKGYYQIKTFTFSSLLSYYELWYPKTKSIPKNMQQFFTPVCLAIWVMGDRSAMGEGGFKISSDSFTQADNPFLCELLFDRYNIKTNVLTENKKNKKKKTILYKNLQRFSTTPLFYNQSFFTAILHGFAFLK